MCPRAGNIVVGLERIGITSPDELCVCKPQGKIDAMSRADMQLHARLCSADVADLQGCDGAMCQKDM